MPKKLTFLVVFRHIWLIICLFITAIVAEVTQPSLGVGYEIGRAVAMGKRILCLYRPQPDKRKPTEFPSFFFSKVTSLLCLISAICHDSRSWWWRLQIFGQRLQRRTARWHISWILSRMKNGMMKSERN